MDGVAVENLLVAHPLFRVVMVLSAAAIFWVSFVKMPSEYLERRRRGVPDEVEKLVQQNWGDVSLAAASRRSSAIVILILPITGVQCLLMGILGREYGLNDWLWFLLSILGVLVVAFFARQFGWPNFLVPEALRDVPGLMILRLRRYRDRKGRTGSSED